MTKENIKDVEKFVDKKLDNVSDVTDIKELPDPSLLFFYKEQKDRIIHIDGSVGGMVGMISDNPEESFDTDLILIADKIIEWNREDKYIPVDQRKVITIKINTLGGDTQATYILTNVMKLSKTPIRTINMSLALSAGSHLLAGGTPGYRYGLPGSMVLIHSGSCQIGGSRETVESAKKYLDNLDKKLTDQILSDTKIDPKEYKKKAPFDWYLTAEEALERGVIDKIVTDIDEII